MTKPKTFRPSEKTLKRIAEIRETKNFETDTEAINYMFEREDVYEQTREVGRVERGAKLSEARVVKRGDSILLPCPTLEKWVDKKLDCEGCHLKCLLLEDQRAYFQGLAYFTEREV